MFKTIKSRLVAASVGIVLAALLLATVTSYRTLGDTVRGDVAERLGEEAQTQADGIAAWVRTQKNIVEALTPAFDLSDPRTSLQEAQRAGSLDLAYLGSADKRMISIPDRQRAADYDPTSRSWYKLASGSADAVITAPYIAASSKKLVVSFAAARRQGDQLLGVAGTDVALDEVVATLQRIKPTASGFAFLVDAKGQIIAHPRSELTLKPMSELSPALTPALISEAMHNSEQLSELQAGEQRLLIKAAPVAGTDWTLVSAADRGEALGSLNRLLRNTAAVVVLVLLGAAVGATLLVNTLLGRLIQLRDAMRQIGAGQGGDLTQRLADHGQDELSDMAAAFNQFVDKIEHVMRDVRVSAESIATASREIALGSQDLSARTEQTASNLEQTASAMEHLTETVQHSADSAQEASHHAEGSAQVANRGGEVASQVGQTMDEISASSRRIADIIGVIDGIAFQTNILALNAAVEAARAGEQGRGFAVVAAEVRSLAQRSANAAREIKALIGGSVDKVGEGARLVGQAGQTMGEIVASVRTMTGIIAEISTGAAEQSRGIREINQAVSQLDQMTQQNAALVEQSAAAAESLKDQAARLSAIVGTFRISER